MRFGEPFSPGYRTRTPTLPLTGVIVAGKPGRAVTRGAVEFRAHHHRAGDQLDRLAAARGRNTAAKAGRAGILGPAVVSSIGGALGLVTGRPAVEAAVLADVGERRVHGGGRDERAVPDKPGVVKALSANAW
ncbi:hypothetical protein [Amycolatopsis sp. WAC 01375]|uniref:hypothetical protein n=1 Tax=Amycolatopsis sp. WAC 01375 TaxID=2203194 RepID=UPI000F7801BE|nr:hypothetical protein [Amycolatopsis sp. WAC 01375]